MSSNKGKDGEMVLGLIIIGAALEEDGLDYTRPTITNQSDLGADYVIKSAEKDIRKILRIGADLSTPEYALAQSENKAPVETRFDVKTTAAKIKLDETQKFVGDVRKHPLINTHVLFGGASLTKAADNFFKESQKTLANDGKTLVYINNEGQQRLKAKYRETILLALEPTAENKDSEKS